jgi:hypothetical protein
MPLRIRHGRGLLLQIGAACVVGAAAVAAGGAPQDPKDDKSERKYDKPSLNIRVAPPIAFSPARIVVTAELKGGAPDDPELYCPNVEWDWGDGTRSEATENCEPFEDGKSTVKRRWTTSHVRHAGNVSCRVAPQARIKDDRRRQQHRAGEARRARHELRPLLSALRLRASPYLTLVAIGTGTVHSHRCLSPSPSRGLAPSQSALPVPLPKHSGEGSWSRSSGHHSPSRSRYHAASVTVPKFDHAE